MPLVGQLLAYATTEAPLQRSHSKFGWGTKQGDPQQYEWATAGGLGPLVYKASKSFADRMPVPWREMITSADLTARVRHRDLIDTTMEIVDACDLVQVEVVLLKGI